MIVQDMLERAIQEFGTSDLITIMLSQARDKEIVEAQLEIYKKFRGK